MIKKIWNWKWLFVIIEVCTFLMIIFICKKASNDSIRAASPELRYAAETMWNNFQIKQLTPEGQLLTGAVGMMFVGFVVVPLLYMVNWIHRLFNWLDIRNIKRKHEEEKKAMELLIPTLATGD